MSSGRLAIVAIRYQDLLERAKFIVVVMGIISVFLVIAETSTPWALVSDKNGVKLYEAEIQKTSIVAFAGETVIEAPIGKVASVLVDVSRRIEWTTNLKSAKILEKKSPNEWIEYNHVGTPFILSDRDFVLAAKTQIAGNFESWSINYHSVEHRSAPETDYVRGEVRLAAFELKALDENRTQIWAEAHADPKGAIPKWIVNLFQREWPRKALAALKRQVARDDIVDITKSKRF